MSSTPTTAKPAPAAPTEELLSRLDAGGPRYTSYPTADRFVEAFGPAQYRQALGQRRSGPQSAGAVGGSSPLSLYVHVPFCESVCYYCACNKVITRQHRHGAEYLESLGQEIALHVGALGPGQRVSQLHLGGGTPTFLSDGELTQLMSLLRAAFDVQTQAECSIEVDPRTVDAGRLAHLKHLGFNRLSFGVQDFDPAVQQAVHRIQPQEQVSALMASARALGFDSINIDLIHGLPKQTPASLARTVEQVARLRPDRVALYGYAHLPQRFKPQRRIHAQDLPGTAQRVTMLSNAIAGFLEHGYDYIGMDHFALPTDALATAKRQGRLHRNFQGYSTQPDCDLIGLGVSAIGRVGATYSQNAKSLPEYQDALRAGELPVVRGLVLTRDDVVRRSVIMALMCQGRVVFESIELAHLLDFRRYFDAELQRLEPLVGQGLVEIDADAIQLTPLGWYFVRAVAMVFDRHLQADRDRERYSRLI
ncbi:oxygen-independent coproporphyrinogen III oxidase [Methylibium sp.]|uniref:oxygen-independent coproporphyrinogen III oxidase n=1 Tax=Methylibium sp. TaxID=2067992 RepID=UPI003D0CB5FB